MFFELILDEVPVSSLGFDKFLVRAAFGDSSLFEYDDLIGIGRSRNAVGNHDDGLSRQGIFEGFLDFGFGLSIECAGAVVKDENVRIGQQCTSEADALFLAAA